MEMVELYELQWRPKADQIVPTITAIVPHWFDELAWDHPEVKESDRSAFILFMGLAAGMFTVFLLQMIEGLKQTKTSVPDLALRELSKLLGVPDPDDCSVNFDEFKDFYRKELVRLGKEPIEVSYVVPTVLGNWVLGSVGQLDGNELKNDELAGDIGFKICKRFFTWWDAGSESGNDKQSGGKHTIDLTQRTIQSRSNIPIDSADKPSVNSEGCTGRLIDCPDCGNQVSRRAECCPHCGCPVEVAEAEKRAGSVGVAKDAPKKATIDSPEQREHRSLSRAARMVPSVTAAMSRWSEELAANHSEIREQHRSLLCSAMGLTAGMYAVTYLRLCEACWRIPNSASSLALNELPKLLPSFRVKSSWSNYTMFAKYFNEEARRLSKSMPSHKVSVTVLAGWVIARFREQERVDIFSVTTQVAPPWN